MQQLRRLLSKLYRSYGFYWDLKSLTQAKAMASIAPISEFWQAGEVIAASLAPYIGRDAVVLDFGCGIGRIARFIAPQCREIWCVDASSQMLKLASEALRGLGNVRFQKAKGTRVPLGDAKFDFAYSILTLQHMEKEDAYVALREIQRVMKIGAWGYFTFPNFLSDEYFTGFLQTAENPDLNPIRVRLYTPEEVEKMLTSLGFKVVRLWNPNSALKRPDEITPLVEKQEPS